MTYLLESGERLQAGCLGYHRVAVAGAGLQRQGQAWNGVNAELRYGNLVICDRERRLSQNSIHRQRRLHLQRKKEKKKKEVLLLHRHMTEDIAQVQKRQQLYCLFEAHKAHDKHILD